MARGKSATAEAEAQVITSDDVASVPAEVTAEGTDGEAKTRVAGPKHGVYLVGSELPKSFRRKGGGGGGKGRQPVFLPMLQSIIDQGTTEYAELARYNTEQGAGYARLRLQRGESPIPGTDWVKGADDNQAKIAEVWDFQAIRVAVDSEGKELASGVDFDESAGHQVHSILFARRK